MTFCTGCSTNSQYLGMGLQNLGGQWLTVLTLTNKDTKVVGRFTKQFLRWTREISAETDWAFLRGAMIQREQHRSCSNDLRLCVAMSKRRREEKQCIFVLDNARRLATDPTIIRPATSRGRTHVPPLTAGFPKLKLQPHGSGLV